MSVDYMDISNLCYICLCKKTELLQLRSSKQPGTETWISKLTSCVTEIEWSDKYCICLICSNQLDFVYNFRRLCLESQERRKKTFESTSHERLIKNEKFLGVNVKLEATSGAENNICKNCDLMFTNKEELNEHTSKFHTKDVDTDTENIIDSLSNDDSSSSVDSWKPQRKKVKKTRQTSKTNYGSKSRYIRKSKPEVKKKHATKNRDISISDPTLKCSTCEQTFDTIIKLVRHSRIEHNIERKDVKPYACNKCDRRFTIPCKLKVHMMYHDGIRNEICTHCGKGFPTKKALHVHEQIHQNREYQCSYCPKKFNTKGNRRGHERTVHLDPSKWFACHICGKKFNKKDNLIGHIRRHTNEKPFACQMCEMRFCSSTDLRMHSKTHSNVRQYKCSECDKDYKYRNQLNYHLTRTHNIYR